MPNEFVNEPSEEFLAMEPQWHMTNTLRGGTPAMRAAGKTYLPQDPKEQETSYINRLARSTLTNYYKKTVDKLMSKPLQRPITLADDVPDTIKEYTKNIDMQGTALQIFARDFLESAVDNGLCHVLIDMPDVEAIKEENRLEELTLLHEKEFGIRPYARLVRADELIGWKSEIVRGTKTLTMIRIREFGRRPDPENEFAQIRTRRVRVIETDRWRLFEEIDDEWVPIASGTSTLGKIALVTLYTKKAGFMLGTPLLQDIANLNVQHWQSASDQQNILHVARVPILFATGWGDDEKQAEIVIGAGFHSKAPTGATLEYVEHSGKAIAAGANDLQQIEDRIQLLGMELLVKRAASHVTATARTLDQSEADSPLQLIAGELENALDEILDLMAEWKDMGVDSGGSTGVFKDFGLSMGDIADIDQLLKMRTAREISQGTFWEELKRRGLLDMFFDPRNEVARLNQEKINANETFEIGEEEDEGIINEVGDETGEKEEHYHTLQAGHKTDTVDGHSHTWDEYGIRTSINDGHRHILIKRDTAGGQHGTGISTKGNEQQGAAPASVGKKPAPTKRPEGRKG